MFETKKFVSLYPTSETKTDLLNYCIKNGLDVNAKFDGTVLDNKKDQDYHVTVFYSNNHPNKTIPEKSYDMHQFEVKPIRFEKLGEKENILGIVLEMNNELSTLRNLFEKEYDLKDDYQPYKPHITITYKLGSSEVPKKLPDFKIYLDRLETKDQ